MTSKVDYPGAYDMLIDNPLWVFTDALVHVPDEDLTVVIHKTASGGMTTAMDTAQFFMNDVTNHKSVHFIVGRDGSVVQVVALKDGAGGNCCLEEGNDPYWNSLYQKYGNLNTCTISIEHEDWTSDNSQPMTQAQVDASFKLCKWLQSQYNLKSSQFKGHNTLDPIDKARCPGATYPMADLMLALGGETVINYKRLAFEAEYSALVKKLDLGSGIATADWNDYEHDIFHGPALSNEYTVKDWGGNRELKAQLMAGGRYEWDEATKKAIYYPYK